MVKRVIWPLKAQLQLEEIFRYIAADSYTNAEKVKVDILNSTRKIEENAEMHPLDKYKIIMMEVSGLMNCIGIELLTALQKTKLL